MNGLKNFLVITSIFIGIGSSFGEAPDGVSFKSYRVQLDRYSANGTPSVGAGKKPSDGILAVVRSVGQPKFVAGKDYYLVRAGLGPGLKTVDCYFFDGRLSLSSTIKEFIFKSMKGILEYQIASIENGIKFNSSYLRVEIGYLSPELNSKGRGYIKYSAIANDVFTLICSHDTRELDAEYNEIVTKLYESASRPIRENKNFLPPIYEGFSQIYLDDFVVGGIHDRVYRDDKDQVLVARYINMIADFPKIGIQSFDSVTIEKSNGDGSLMDGQYSTLNNDKLSQIKLETKDLRNYFVRGQIGADRVASEIVERDGLKGFYYVTKQLSRLVRYMKKERGKIRINAYVPGVQPNQPVSLAYEIVRKEKDLADVKMSVAGFTIPMVMDVNGMPSSAQTDKFLKTSDGGVPVTVKRVYQTGSI